MNEKFYEKYVQVVFLIIGVMVLIGAIPHTFDINTNPALVQFISSQTIDEIKISYPITYESSVLILLIKVFFGRGVTQAQYVMREWLSAFEYRIPLSDNKSYLQWLGEV